MYRNKKISLCLPCRNEAKNLKHMAAQVPISVDETIIISNASTDDSVKVAKSLGLRTIKDDRTLNGIGYGFAHMTGITAARGDIIVGADCDGTYPLEELEAAVDYLLKNDLDFVSCNRYPIQTGTQIPLLLRLGVSLLNLEVRLLYGVKVHDILSGMWVFRREAAERLQLTKGDWNLSPQIKLNAATNPLIKFGEFSISQHERRGKSHQAYIKTGMSHAAWIFSNWLTGKRLSRLADNPPVDIALDLPLKNS